MTTEKQQTLSAKSSSQSLPPPSGDMARFGLKPIPMGYSSPGPFGLPVKEHVNLYHETSVVRLLDHIRALESDHKAMRERLQDIGRFDPPPDEECMEILGGIAWSANHVLSSLLIKQ